MRSQDTGKEEAFRFDYGHISELRSILKSKEPFVALTATATEAVRKTIIKDLSMRNCVELITLPDKPNTKFSVFDINKDDLYETFSWLITELKMQQQNTQKVVIYMYCRKRAPVKELYKLFTDTLGPNAYVCPNGDEPKNDRARIFAMYHRNTHCLVKEVMERKICKTNGSIQVVFAQLLLEMELMLKVQTLFFI